MSLESTGICREESIMRTNRNKYFSIPKTRRGDLLTYWEGGESGHWVICSMQGVVLEYADDSELQSVLDILADEMEESA